MVSFAASAIADNAPVPPPDNLCGVNSLYVFLKAMDVNVSKAQILRDTPRSADGTSLKELQDTARNFGVETSVYKCNASDLGAALSLPVIVLFQARSDTVGHYGMVYQVDPGEDGRVHWIEGTVGYDYSRSKSDFEKEYWSGFVLARPTTSGVPILLVALSCIHATVWVCVMASAARKLKEPIVLADVIERDVCPV